MAHKSPAKRHAEIEVNAGLDGRLTAVSYEPKASMSFARWQEAGVTFGRMSRSIQFWVADWLVWGEEKFGEKFAQALDGTGRDPKTLLEWSRVGRSVRAVNRREELSFAHHEAVSVLDAEEQRFWLQRCLEGDKLPNGEVEVWSSKRLRAEIRGAGPQDDDPEINVEVIDKSLVPLQFMVVDVGAVRAAYKEGTTEIEGLRLLPAEVAPAALEEKKPARKRKKKDAETDEDPDGER